MKLGSVLDIFLHTLPPLELKAASVLQGQINKDLESPDTKSAQADLESIESLQSLAEQKGYLLTSGASKVLMAFANVPLDEKELREVNQNIMNAGLGKGAQSLSADVLILVSDIFNRAFM